MSGNDDRPANDRFGGVVDCRMAVLARFLVIWGICSTICGSAFLYSALH